MQFIKQFQKDFTQQIITVVWISQKDSHEQFVLSYTSINW